MNVLPDTHLLVWSAIERKRLPAAARTIMEHPDHELYFSAVSFWEIAIKRSLNKPDFLIDPLRLRKALLAHGYRELPLTTDHTLVLLNLPPVHKDLFDRILIAQAISEGMTLLTADATVAKYPAPIRKV